MKEGGMLVRTLLLIPSYITLLLQESASIGRFRICQEGKIEPWHQIGKEKTFFDRSKRNCLGSS